MRGVTANAGSVRFRTDLFDVQDDTDVDSLWASEPGLASGYRDGSRLMERLMNTISRSIVIGGALVMVLVGCQKQDESVVSRVQPSATVTGNSAPVAPTSTPDRSVPDVPGNSAATQNTTALQQKAAPQEKMTKEEESKAMPLPSQANDHSTTALDRSKKK